MVTSFRRGISSLTERLAASRWFCCMYEIIYCTKTATPAFPILLLFTQASTNYQPKLTNFASLLEECCKVDRLCRAASVCVGWLSCDLVTTNQSHRLLWNPIPSIKGLLRCLVGIKSTKRESDHLPPPSGET
jgi:hypothetical protein